MDYADDGMIAATFEAGDWLVVVLTRLRLSPQAFFRPATRLVAFLFSPQQQQPQQPNKSFTPCFVHFLPLVPPAESSDFTFADQGIKATVAQPFRKLLSKSEVRKQTISPRRNLRAEKDSTLTEQLLTERVRLLDHCLLRRPHLHS